MQEKSLAQCAYEAYADARDWKDYVGKPLTDWSEIGLEIQIAWAKAADAVIENQKNY